MTTPTKVSKAIISAISDDSENQSPRHAHAVEIWYRTEDAALVKKIISGYWNVTLKEVED
jgi:hypothetical protein